MYFDGIANKSSIGVREMFITLNSVHLSLTLRLEFPTMNNIMEYEVLILEQEALSELGSKNGDHA